MSININVSFRQEYQYLLEHERLRGRNRSQEICKILEEVLYSEQNQQENNDDMIKMQQTINELKYQVDFFAKQMQNLQFQNCSTQQPIYQQPPVQQEESEDTMDCGVASDSDIEALLNSM